MVKSSITQGTVTIKEVKKIGFSASKLFYEKGNGQCGRYWNILFEGVEIEDSWEHENLRAVDVGSTSHEFLQKELALNIEDIEIEKELWNKNPNIHAFVDAYLPKQNVPIEIKTTRYENYEYRESSMTGTVSNEFQLLLYMYLLDADFGLLIYENRNDLDNIVIPVRMTEDSRLKLDKAFEWMQKVQETFERGEVIKEFAGKRINSVVCSNCEVKTICENKFSEGTVDLPLLGKFMKEESLI